METSEVDTGNKTHTVTVVQLEVRFSITSDQGISQYPDNQQLQPTICLSHSTPRIPSLSVN